MGKSIIITLLISFIVLSTSATRHEVKNLFGDLYEEEIYSGYLNTKIEGDELFYMYIPAKNNPHIAPIILWLNGGPGCSSLFGLLAEVGPVTSDNYNSKFEVNPYTWNKDLNLLVIEQPAGVGFSKTKNPSFQWDDDKMGENLLFAVKDFLNEYSLKNREFYISGESYAGVYIPYLATYILKDNSDDKVNLKGVLIGNGLTDFETDIERSMVEFNFWHGLISFNTYKLYKRYCPHLPDELHPEEDINNLKDNPSQRNVTHRCNEIRKEIQSNLDGLDIYGIYRLCPKEAQITQNDPLFYNSQHTYKKTILDKLKQNKNNKLKGLEPEIDMWPELCNEDLFFDKFLNLNEVKDKLGVDKSISWIQCFPNINYDMGESYEFYSKTMLEHSDLKVWVFSGTEDGVLPTLGTMRWIEKLNFTVEKEWTQYKVEDQVVGYAQKYKEGLVLVTIKGAGHMVPQDQRAAAFKMFDSFVKGIMPFDE